MKTGMIIGLTILSAILLVCAVVARRSQKSIGYDVFLMESAILGPLVGNLLIIVSGNLFISLIGGYLFYIGIDLTVAALLRFVTDYCGVPYKETVWRKLVLAIVVIDIVQLLLNPVFGHAFTMRPIMVEGAPYYALVPLAGQTVHRLVVYGILFVSFAIYFYKTVTAPRIYLERYLLILIAMVLTIAWGSYYVLSGSPIDLSMIGYGAFGVIIFYLSLYYKPRFLLNGILARVVGDMNQAVLFFDRECTCIYANAAAQKLFCIRDENDMEQCSHKVASLVGEEQFSAEREWSCRCRSLGSADGSLRLAGGASAEAGVSSDAAAGVGDTVRYFELVMRVMEDKRNCRVGAFLTVLDRTAEENALEQERRAAGIDPLTGLFNARHLYESARQLMADNPDIRYHVVAVDVLRFKLINDVYSKEVGDKVLRSIANNMREHVVGNEVYGRISGDKFGCVIPDDVFDIARLERVMSSEQFESMGITYPIVVHMGVYEVVEKDLPVSVMFDRAFMAISSIKSDYSRRVAIYDENMRDRALWDQKISSELEGALASGQIQPHLQPLMNDKGEVVGAEVLVRWHHPEEGLLSPARFIPTFEENGQIAQLDRYMWERACQILAAWEQAGVDLFLSVNISPKDFYFMDVFKTIGDLAHKYKVDPARLRLEITETVMMSDAENRLHVIEDLRRAGFMVEMDDFGSGYSSLNMLKDMPVDVLKIDMMFLYKAKDQARAETILQTVINLSGNLGILSVTEGVETAEQFKMLTTMGCCMFQGYYFAKPMPLGEFEELYCKAA